MSLFNPRIRCRGSFTSGKNSCNNLLASMSADKKRVMFGPRNMPNVQQGLPMSLSSCELLTAANHPANRTDCRELADGRCVLQIFSNGKPDEAMWYWMWEGATAIYSACIREHGFGGVFEQIGWFIYVHIRQERTHIRPRHRR